MSSDPWNPYQKSLGQGTLNRSSSDRSIQIRWSLIGDTLIKILIFIDFFTFIFVFQKVAEIRGETLTYE